MNIGQLVTRYIKHLAVRYIFKGSTFNKHSNGLIGNRFEMPNVSYTRPLTAYSDQIDPLIPKQIDPSNPVKLTPLDVENNPVKLTPIF